MSILCLESPSFMEDFFYLSRMKSIEQLKKYGEILSHEINEHSFEVKIGGYKSTKSNLKNLMKHIKQITDDAFPICETFNLSSDSAVLSVKMTSPKDPELMGRIFGDKSNSFES